MGLELYHQYNKLDIKFDLIRPDEGFVIKAKPQNKIRTSWSIEIKQQKKILYFPKRIRKKSLMSDLYIANNFLSWLSLAFTFVTITFINKIDIQKLHTFNDYLKLSASILLGVFLFGTSIELLKRVKAKRPPKEILIRSLEKK